MSDEIRWSPYTSYCYDCKRPFRVSWDFVEDQRLIHAEIIAEELADPKGERLEMPDDDELARFAEFCLECASGETFPEEFNLTIRDALSHMLTA